MKNKQLLASVLSVIFGLAVGVFTYYSELPNYLVFLYLIVSAIFLLAKHHADIDKSTSDEKWRTLLTYAICSMLLCFNVLSY